MGETNSELPETRGSKHAALRMVLYGRPCANCRCYYESELEACPVCRCKERIPIVASVEGSLWNNHAASVSPMSLDDV